MPPNAFSTQRCTSSTNTQQSSVHVKCSCSTAPSIRMGWVWCVALEDKMSGTYMGLKHFHLHKPRKLVIADRSIFPAQMPPNAFSTQRCTSSTNTQQLNVHVKGSRSTAHTPNCYGGNWCQPMNAKRGATEPYGVGLIVGSEGSWERSHCYEEPTRFAVTLD